MSPRRRRYGRRRSALLPSVLGALVFVTAASAPAAAATIEEPRYRVVLLKPAVTDEVTTDALARVRGELTAAGFDVRIIDQDPTRDVHDALETSGRELDPIATFAIIRGDRGSPGASLAEIWVCDRIAGKSVIQNVRLDREAREPERDAVVLAVAAVEMLKASLAQYWVAPARSTHPVAAGDATTPSPPAGPSAAPAAYGAGIAVQAGVGRLDSVGAVSAVWEPLVRISYVGRNGWGGRLTVGGMGSSAELRSAPGSAQIEQQLAALDLVRTFFLGGRVRLFVAAGAGVYRLHVGGTGVAPSYTGRDEASWSALGVAGGGIAVALVPHVALLLEAQGLVTLPHAIVRINGADAGETGWPGSLVSGGVLGTF